MGTRNWLMGGALATLVGAVLCGCESTSGKVAQGGDGEEAGTPTSETKLMVTTTPTAEPLQLLSGGQFDFFSQPIREKMKSDDLLRTWRSIPVRVLRYPGGTWADHYIWNNPAKGHFAVGTADTIITPKQCIDICQKIGAEPIFQVNTMSVDETANRINPNDIETIRMGAKRAAEWVREANIEKKWNVKYWEIGNEVWIWLHPQEYARYVVEYSKAMKAVDPTIKIIACGASEKTGPFNPDPFFNFSKTDPSWTPRTAVENEPVSWYDALFTIAKGSFDYIAPHPYLGAGKQADARGIYLETTRQVWKNEKMKAQYAALEKYNSPAHIAVTEWASNFAYSVSGSGGKIAPKDGYYYMLGNGINMAYYFGRFLEDPRTDIACMHSLGDAQTLWYWPKNELAKEEPLEHPAILGLRVWGNHLGTRRSKVSATGIPSLTIGDDKVPAVYLFASEDDQYRYLVAINLDPDNAHRVVWNGSGAEATMSLLSGAALDTQNFDAWGQKLTPARIETQTVAAVAGACVVDLPKHSMAGLKAKK